MSLNSQYRLNDGHLYAPEEPREFFKVYVRTTQQGFNGVFAAEKIPAGAVIGIDGGVVVSSVDDVPPEKRYAVLISETLFLAPRDYDHLEPFWYFNHSCDSNVARIGGLVFVAKRPTEQDEELTIDYAPLIAGVNNWTMECQCGSGSCRKTITGGDWTKPYLAEQLWNEWLPFIQRKILARK